MAGLKNREFLSKNAPWSYKAYSGGVLVIDNSGVHTAVDSQETLSESHPYGRLGRTGEDLGGDFYTIIKTYSDNSEEVSLRNSGNTKFYVGNLFAKNQYVAKNSSLWPAVNLASSAELAALGSTAISRCLPTNPVASVGTALAELKRDGLPGLPLLDQWRTQTKNFRSYKGRAVATGKSSGNEYLNLEFGWKPMISDIRKFGYAVVKSQEILEQYHRDSGQNVRRGYRFPSETFRSETNLGAAYLMPGLDSTLYGSPSKGTLTLTESRSVETWFSGCFSYSIPMGKDLPSRMTRYAQEANKLFGVLTPETLWEAAPWSWAVDWVTDIGDVFHNISVMSTTGTVMRYGYIMRKQVVEHTYRNKGAMMKVNGTPQPFDLYQTFKVEVKQRQRATPFGFGLDIASFTPKQWAIIAALGISRSPRSLAR